MSSDSTGMSEGRLSTSSVFSHVTSTYRYKHPPKPAVRGSPLRLVARDIVWRAVLPFRTRNIERGPWCSLLRAAVIRALLRARRISIVGDGGSRNQHDKGGRTYHDALHRIG